MAITTYDATTPEGMARRSANQQRYQTHLDEVARSRKNFGRLFNVFRAVGLGVPAGAVAAPFVAGGGVAASAAPAASGAATAAGTTAVGGGMTFGNLLRLGELGAGLTSQLFANRSQGRALDRDAGLRQQEFQAQMAMAQRAEEESRRRWDAEQAQRAQDYTLALEDRQRRQSVEDFDMQRLRDREARRAPYRAMAEQARLRMADLLRLGRG